jgi:hypothetical protein
MKGRPIPPIVNPWCNEAVIALRLVLELPMPPPEKRKPEVAFAGEIGRQAVIFDDGGIVRLLRAAVEREGNQTAFAKRHRIERDISVRVFYSSCLVHS